MGLRHRRVRHQGQAEQAPSCLQWRYGALLSQEGKTRAEEEGDACSGHPTEEDLPEERRPVHILRGQRRGDREQQGWSAITGPVAKECADLWPRIASNASSIC